MLQLASASAAILLIASGCATSVATHPVKPASLGASTGVSMEAALSRPGVVRFERILFAEWDGARGGFIDLDHPTTKAAGVGAGRERARIYAYSLEHPTFGRWLIDAGASERLSSAVGPVMRQALKSIPITVFQTTAGWIERHGPPRGVLLTHLHFDHIGGLLDLPRSTPVFAGPGETSPRHWTNTVLGRPADRILKGLGPIEEWRFQADPDGAFAGTVDVFGDGSVWAISVPGHTPGSTAYLVQSTDGPKLVVGDAVHTRLGWELGLPQSPIPGSSVVVEESARRLKAFAARHGEVEVFLGHQSRPGQAEPTPGAPVR